VPICPALTFPNTFFGERVSVEQGLRNLKS
jgi:hypothetical protein